MRHLGTVGYAEWKAKGGMPCYWKNVWTCMKRQKQSILSAGVAPHATGNPCRLLTSILINKNQLHRVERKIKQLLKRSPKFTLPGDN